MLDIISGAREGTIVDGVNLDEIREFAKQFKIRRLSLGLTQTQVGQALSATEGPSYSQSAICRLVIINQLYSVCSVCESSTQKATSYCITLLYAVVLLGDFCTMFVASGALHTVRVKKIFPRSLFVIFQKRLGIFRPNFMCLLRVPIYARLRIFIQLSATLTKLCQLCHIKRTHHVRKMSTIGRNARWHFLTFSPNG